MCVPEILQMRDASQKWNNAGQVRTVLCTVSCLFLMKHEPPDGEVLVSSPFTLCDQLQTFESVGSEFQGGNERDSEQAVLSHRLHRRRHKGP